MCGETVVSINMSSVPSSRSVRKFYIISFDLETTGRSVKADTICELGFAIHIFDFGCEPGSNLVKSLHTERLEPFHAYCKPSTPMHPEARQVHGLTDDFLCDKPTPETSFDLLQIHLDRVLVEADVPRILLAYNGKSFDLPLVVHEADRHRSDVSHYFRQWKISSFVDVLLFNRLFLDEEKLLRKTNGRCSYRLGDVYKALFSKPLDGAHGAIADSEAVVEIVKSEHCRQEFFDILANADPSSAGGAEGRKKCCFNLMAEVRDILRSGTVKRKRTRKEFFSKRRRHPADGSLILGQEDNKNGATKKKIDNPVDGPVPLDVRITG